MVFPGPAVTNFESAVFFDELGGDQDQGQWTQKKNPVMWSPVMSHFQHVTLPHITCQSYMHMSRIILDIS